MTDQQIIIAVAKLDGWREAFPRDPELGKEQGGILLPYFYEKLGTKERRMEYPPYLTSHDAIIPVIEKVYRGSANWPEFERQLEELHGEPCRLIEAITTTPKDLCIALLKATGNYIEP